MNTNFFTGWQQLGCLPATTLTITLTEVNGQVVVTLLPKMKVDDATKDQIAPICLKGTYEELNEGFFTALTKPLAQVSGLAVELAQFEASQKKAQTDNAKAKKEKEAKEKNKKKADELLKSAQDLADQKKGNDAISTCQQAVDLVPDYPKANKLLDTLKKQFGIYPQADLFSKKEPSGNPPKAEQPQDDSEQHQQANPKPTGMPATEVPIIEESPAPAVTVPPIENPPSEQESEEQASEPSTQSPLNTPNSYFHF
ncbi:PRTRC system protein E [Tunicatimonas pelagia]|uniref:PRTRC system protein E n=1 Tax=Tunicatimonas pelagia TaxID=931531 RepID=UPI00266643E1|nr:PRTRC system protein E [Tunicatimonas pelagia]WKN46453.1 PRTRC system protein E [Tunicatimonas pelagia]